MKATRSAASNFHWSTLALAVLTIGALVAALPGAVRAGLERGDLYLFSQSFFDDLPRRLSGPGKMRFIFQPIVATTLGVLAARKDVGSQLANLFLLSILFDLAAQWLILGVAYPAAALVVGPVLITLPFLAARACARLVQRRS